MLDFVFQAAKKPREFCDVSGVIENRLEPVDVSPVLCWSRAGSYLRRLVWTEAPTIPALCARAVTLLACVFRQSGPGWLQRDGL